MGVSSKKQKTTTQQNTMQNAVTQRTNPQWVTDAVQGFTGRISDFANSDAGSMVAGPTALQNSAYSGAAGLGSNLAVSPTVASTQLGNAALADRVNLGQAQTAEAQQATGSRANQYMSDYLNPYLEDVVDTTIADYDANSGQVRAAQAAAAARNGAFGGSRYGIQEAATEGELARGRASTAAGLRSNAYNFAGQMGASDADRLTNVSLNNAQLGTQTNLANAAAQNNFALTQGQLDQQRNLANTGAQNNFALTQGQLDQQRNLAQAGYDSSTSQFNVGARQSNLGLQAQLGEQQRQIQQQQKLAELAKLQAEGNLLGQANFGLFNGTNVTGTGSMNGSSTTKSSPSLFDQVMGGVQLGSAIFGA